MKKVLRQARTKSQNPSPLPPQKQKKSTAKQPSTTKAKPSSSDYETKQDLLDGLREAFHDVMTGNVYPVSILDELEDE
jgi:hypothetical protein